MTLLLIALGILMTGGTAAICAARRARSATLFGAGGAAAGCALGVIPSLRILLEGRTESLRLDWNVPGGAFYVQVDALSAFFLAPVFVLAAVAAVYGGEYMLAYRDRKALGPPWFFFNLFVASMVLVVIARNAVLFLAAWEVMSVAAFFLVAFEHEKPEVRRAGWIYLIATHLGTAFLLAMFLLLGRQSGTLDFDGFGAASHLAPGSAAVIFVLALIGFGTKAGLVPLHVWLPEAHPAAPSHVSALMSGVMIKLGIYGLLRTMVFLGRPAAWWGPTLVVVGLTGTVLGIALAMVQRDVKCILAYSSIENMGLIVLALGVGLWGTTCGHPMMAALGFAGALLHIWNHSLMKGLLFLSAGSVLHGTGAKDTERLGGLMKRMPQTGLAMALGAVAIAALPPMNGFVSEWLIYMGMIHGGLSLDGFGRMVLLLAVGVLAIAGALALICFVRLVGVVLLGQARSEDARQAHESPRWMTVPLGLLCILCAGLAVFPGVFARIFSKTAEQISGISADRFVEVLTSAQSPLATLGMFNAVIWCAAGVTALALLGLRRRCRESADTTWGCGYAAPTARMQYTGQSFVELMVTQIFPGRMRPKTVFSAPQGIFPSESGFASTYPDPVSSGFYEPFFSRWADRFTRLRWVQQGKIHLYVLYFVVVLVAAFVWVIGRRWVMP